MTLTEISYYSRKLAPLSIILFLILLIVFYGFKLLFVLLQGKTTTRAEINPTFGKIKGPFIPDAVTSADLKFKLDTVEGEPITASDTAKIIFIPPTASRFGYREKVYLIAKTVGIDTDAVKYRIVDKDAVFDDANQKLSIDITNFNFRYQYFFENNPEIFGSSETPDKRASEDRASYFLDSIGRYPEELASGKINSILLTYDPLKKTIGPAESNGSANLIEIDYYRPDIDGFPTVSSNYFNSPNYVLLANTGSDYKVIRAQIRFFERSEDQVGIYPIKTGNQAYTALQGGKGLVVSNPSKRTDIVIKKMFMGYFDPDVYQEYLQPVYVFLGEDNFVAYVPAITDEYLTE